MKFTTITTAVALFCASVYALDKPLDIKKTHSEECADSERTKIGICYLPLVVSPNI